VKLNQKMERRAAWYGGIAAVLLSLLFHGSFIGERLIRASYDIPLSLKKNKWVTPEDVIIVYEDPGSHEELKQRFDAAWDRKVHAKLLRKLKEDGSRAVIFDIVFDQPSPNPDDDVVFAAAIREHGKVVIGDHFLAIGEKQGGAVGTTSVHPIPILATNAAAIGLVEVFQDLDVVVRMLYSGHSQGLGGDELASFTWRAAQIDGAPVTKEPNAHLKSRWLNYYGPPEQIASVSYSRAINHTPPGFFKDKLVLVGVAPDISFTGAGKDTFNNPMFAGRPLFAGVEIHATALANLVRSQWLRRADTPFEAVAFAITGLLLGFGLIRLRPVLATMAAVAAVVLLFAFAYIEVVYLRFWFPWLIIALVQLPVAWIWSVIFHWVKSMMEKQFLEQSLSMYLSPKLVKKFSRDRDVGLLKPGAVKQKLTIIFSDIASFTSISEGMDSDELAKMMNEYFQGAVGKCIHATDGTVVKYIGDAIFAFWNAPEPQGDHAVRACEAALRFREMSAQEVRGKKLITRIGLHTGTANVGNFGSETRVDYTAIGEDVNLASRMEGLNKYLGTTVLMTGAVKAEIGDKFATRFLGRFQLKGFERAVEVYELLGSGSPATNGEFAHAIEFFTKRDLVSAENAFTRITQKDPNDGPAQFYLKHLAELRGHELPPNWHGEVELKEK
jgi:adenylate cyclase